MGKYVDQADLENALSAQTVAQLYADEATSGAINIFAINDAIDRAEGEVDSYLIGVLNLSSVQNADRLLKGAALDFLICFSFERDPEYVRTFGDNPRGFERFKRAEQRMKRIQAAVQQLPDQQAAVKPANVGGIVSTPFPKMTLGDAGLGF